MDLIHFPLIIICENNNRTRYAVGISNPLLCPQTLLFRQPRLISSRPGFESIAINHGVDIEKNWC